MDQTKTQRQLQLAGRGLKSQAIEYVVRIASLVALAGFGFGSTLGFLVVEVILSILVGLAIKRAMVTRGMRMTEPMRHVSHALCLPITAAVALGFHLGIVLALVLGAVAVAGAYLADLIVGPLPSDELTEMLYANQPHDEQVPEGWTL